MYAQPYNNNLNLPKSNKHPVSDRFTCQIQKPAQITPAVIYIT